MMKELWLVWLHQKAKIQLTNNITCRGDKVFIYKSRGEQSLLVQPTIQCVFLAHLTPQKIHFKNLEHKFLVQTL